MQADAVKNTANDAGRVEALDLLRLTAVIGVMSFHFCFFGPELNGKPLVAFPEWADAAKYGYLGVQLFFVISGFVIAYSAAGRSASAFAIARFSRIYPAFLFCMTLTFLVTMTLGQGFFEAPLKQWFANLLIVSTALKQPYVDGVYWTLILELTFYAWMYLLIAGNIFPRHILTVLVGWFAISLANELWIGSHIARKLLLTDQSGFFASGLLIYEISRGRGNAVVQTLLGCAAMVAIVQAIRHVEEMTEMTGAAFDISVVAALAAGCVALTVIAARLPKLPISSRVTSLLGGITYPLYLLHQMIGYVAFLLLRNDFAAGPLLATVVAAVMLGSWAVWRFVDRPGQRMTKRVLTHSVDRAAPVLKRMVRPVRWQASPSESANAFALRIRAEKFRRFSFAPAV